MLTPWDELVRLLGRAVDRLYREALILDVDDRQAVDELRGAAAQLLRWSREWTALYARGELSPADLLRGALLVRRRYAGIWKAFRRLAKRAPKATPPSRLVLPSGEPQTAQAEAGGTWLAWTMGVGLGVLLLGLLVFAGADERQL